MWRSTSKGSDGARKLVPSAQCDVAMPPGRITCGSSYISQGRAIGEKGMPLASNCALSVSISRAAIFSATSGIVQTSDSSCFILEIGRASCRERGVQYVESYGGDE